MELGKESKPTAPKADRLRDAALETLTELAQVLSMAADALGSAHLPDVEGGTDFYQEVRRFEVALIQRALKLTGGNRARAARLLNLKQTTLHEMIKRYEINPDTVIFYHNDPAPCVNAHCEPQ